MNNFINLQKCKKKYLKIYFKTKNTKIYYYLNNPIQRISIQKLVLKNCV